jgi:HD-GYP domain-containing protein (c-di-GMP phosphodiesterase class II)
MPQKKSELMHLTERIAQLTSDWHQVAYACVDKNLRIVQVSPHFPSELADADLTESGVPLDEAFSEFVGMEEVLKSILHGELPFFQIERVNRIQPDGSIRYLTFRVAPRDAEKSGTGLLIIVEDVTRLGLIEHSLLQNRNELSLAQAALARLNAELDKRVELRTAELAEAKQQIEQQFFRLQALRVNDIAILGTTDLRVALKTIAEQTRKQLNVDLISILLFNSHSLMLETAVVVGAQTSDLLTARVRLGETLIGRAALERRILAFPDLKTDPYQDRWVKGEKLEACYVIPLIAKGNGVGVLFLGQRSILQPNNEWLDFLETLAGQAAMAIESIKAFEDLQRSNYELALAYNRTIEGWSHALDLRDKETKEHTTRVTEMTITLAHLAGMNEDEILHVRHGALLHDIGKMGIPDAVLLKEAHLTDEEWNVMRKHPTYAYEMLFPIEYLRPALDIPYCHHEKWDGTGYPRGLRGEEIPLSARLFAVVDVWDALRSDRPYRKGWSEEKVREHIRVQSGTHFDPQAVELFLRFIDDADQKGTVR